MYLHCIYPHIKFEVLTFMFTEITLKRSEQTKQSQYFAYLFDRRTLFILIDDAQQLGKNKSRSHLYSALFTHKDQVKTKHFISI